MSSTLIVFPKQSFSLACETGVSAPWCLSGLENCYFAAIGLTSLNFFEDVLGRHRKGHLHVLPCHRRRFDEFRTVFLTKLGRLDT